jgi:putative oxidoreductase
MVHSTRVVRLLFVILLAYSGSSKLFDSAAFASSLQAYAFLPEAWLHFFIYYIPVLEIVIAIALVIPSTYKAALLGGLVLISVFQVALSSLLLRGIDADCGCLGSFGSSPATALVRNFFLLTALLFLTAAVCRQSPEDSIN